MIFYGIQVEKAIGRSTTDRRLMTTLEGGRPALSFVRGIAREKELLLVEVKPRTGRTHQIRVAGTMLKLWLFNMLYLLIIRIMVFLLGASDFRVFFFSAGSTLMIVFEVMVLDDLIKWCRNSPQSVENSLLYANMFDAWKSDLVRAHMELLS